MCQCGSESLLTLFLKEESVEHPTTIAVDLAKSVFEVSVSREPGRVCQRKRLSRSQFARFLALEPPATVLMEACGTAHYWARLAQDRGSTRGSPAAPPLGSQEASQDCLSKASRLGMARPHDHLRHPQAPRPDPQGPPPFPSGPSRQARHPHAGAQRYLDRRLQRPLPYPRWPLLLPLDRGGRLQSFPACLPGTALHQARGLASRVSPSLPRVRPSHHHPNR